MKLKILLTKRALIFISLILSVIISLCGYYYYSYEKKLILLEKQNELEAIAALKSSQISDWYAEQLNDVQNFSKNVFLIQYINDLLNHKIRSNNVLLKQYLTSFVNEHDLHNIVIVSASCKILLSYDKTVKDLDSILFLNTDHSIKTQSVVATDLYISSIDNEIHLDFIAPVINEINQSVAALVIQIDPNKFLFPFIQSWPISSVSSETLLLRRENNKVLFLNELRHKKNTALKLDIPPTKKNTPAVMAWFGKKGIVEGRDYRDVEVLADILPVPGTPWIMIAKIDKSELFEYLWYRALIISLLSAVSILFLAAGISFLYKYRQSTVYKNLLIKEKELRENVELFKTTLYSIGDGVITTDVSGCVQHVNAIAESLTGWKENEVRNKKIEDVFNIVNEYTRLKVENPVDLVLKEKKIVGIANHLLLISKNGKETAIADSGSPIINEDGKLIGVVLVFRDQTEERKAKSELEKREYKLNSIFRSAPVGIGMAVNGVIIEANEKLCNITGYCVEELLKQDTRKLYCNFNENNYIGEGKESQIFDIKTKTVTTKWKRKDGEIIDILLSSTPLDVKDIYGGVTFTALDITGKVKAQDELTQYKLELENLVEKRTKQLNETNKRLALEIKKQKEYDTQLKDQLFMLSTFIDSMATAAFIKDVDLKFIEVNHAFEEMLGLKKKNIIGKTVKEIFPAHIADILTKQDMAVLKRKNLETFNLRYIDRNDIERFLLINKVIYNKVSGEFGGILGTYIDISEQKRLQESIERSLEREKELNELKTRFISMASHEFRTPLTSIRIFSDLIEMQKDKNDKEKLSEHIEKIQKSVGYMTELIDDVLMVSRADTGKLKFMPEKIDIKSLCKDLIAEMKLNITGKHNLILDYNLKNNKIFADPKLLRLIITNLLSNSVKYSPNGGEVKLSLEMKKNTLILLVQDDGIGMSETVMRNLFEPFLRGDNTGSIPGTGLGLSIIKKAVDMHNGQIDCKSALNEGTSFSVKIPVNMDK